MQNAIKSLSKLKTIFDDGLFEYNALTPILLSNKIDKTVTKLKPHSENINEYRTISYHNIQFLFKGLKVNANDRK